MKKRTCIPYYGKPQQRLEAAADKLARAGQHAASAAIHRKISAYLRVRRRAVA